MFIHIFFFCRIPDEKELTQSVLMLHSWYITGMHELPILLSKPLQSIIITLFEISTLSSVNFFKAAARTVVLRYILKRIFEKVFILNIYLFIGI